jgi:hypothetical protein
VSAQKETGAHTRAPAQMGKLNITPNATTAVGRVLSSLISQEWVCATELWRIGGFAYTSRLSDLRRLGYRLDRRRCQNSFHNHPSGQMCEWALVGKPGERLR